MSSLLLADLLVVVHFLFVVFVVGGGLLALRWPKVAWLHVPAALWGAWIEFTGAICPLTPLEQQLRARAGQTAYEGDFVAHYILPLLYPLGLTRPTQMVLGGLVVALNLAVYAVVWGRWRAQLVRGET
ncbi:MAG TPA: DUF2784 domain-containing protein [Gemmatimonadales bacterium]|nr:DUF2784 domain-containing protein [Gemmatimonadales bacterium]